MRAGLVGLALGLAWGCGQAQPPPPELRRACTSWKDDLEATITRQCVSCHGPSEPAAGYRADSYAGVITRARAGDATSPLVTAIDPAGADSIHAGFGPIFSVVRRWVVECDLNYQRSEIHGPGLMNPTAADFHGKVARDHGFDLELCASCHGADFSGGKANASCRTCHTDGPTSCTTCHGQPPQTGAHLGHVAGSTLGRSFDCSECHLKPDIYSAAGHLHPPPGHVRFGALAGAAASWNAETKICSNVGCHGGGRADSRASHPDPTWVADAAQVACGTCHGLPPSGHASSSTRCADCHSLVVDAANHFVDRTRHVDGHVDLAGGTGCTSCHGQPPATGAHRAHTEARHQLRGPIACGECHTVPQTIDSPAHIDGVAQVFPTAASGLAGADGAQPSWNRDTATCSGVYCHGGGARLQTDPSPGLAQAPRWLDGTQAALCGSCHGIPPATPAHAARPGLTECAGCHAQTMEPSGAIRITDGTSAHLNGVVDVQ